MIGMCKFRVSALAFFAATTCQAQIVTNGDFELPGVSDGTVILFGGGTTLAGWTASPGVGSAYVDNAFTNGAPNYFPGAYGGSDYMYVNDQADNNSVDGASISQSINLLAGTTYHLSFAMAGTRDFAPGVSVLLGSLNRSFVGAVGATWALFSWDFTPTVGGATPLSFVTSFAANGGHDVHLALDAVSITPVPEPETWALMIAGLAAICTGARRRQRGGTSSASYDEVNKHLQVGSARE